MGDTSRDRPGEREEGQTGLQRAVAEHDLHEDGQEEEDAEDRASWTAQTASRSGRERRWRDHGARSQWLVRWMTPTSDNPLSMSCTASAASRKPKTFSVTSIRLASR